MVREMADSFLMGVPCVLGTLFSSISWYNVNKPIIRRTPPTIIHQLIAVKYKVKSCVIRIPSGTAIPIAASRIAIMET